MKASMVDRAKKLLATLREIRGKAESLHEASGGLASLGFKDDKGSTTYVEIPLANVHEGAMQAVARQAWDLVRSLENIGVDVPALPDWLPRSPEPPSWPRMEEVLASEYRAVDATLLVHESDVGRSEDYLTSGIYNGVLELNSRPLRPDEITEIAEHEEEVGPGEGYIDWNSHQREES
jgi:hypothetical protein